MPYTIYDDYGRPIGRVSSGRTPFLDKEEEEKMEKGSGGCLMVIAIIFIAVVTLFLAMISAVMPLWLRSFIDPEVVKDYIFRTLLPIIVGGVILVGWILGGSWFSSPWSAFHGFWFCSISPVRSISSIRQGEWLWHYEYSFVFLGIVPSHWMTALQDGGLILWV